MSSPATKPAMTIKVGENIKAMKLEGEWPQGTMFDISKEYSKHGVVMVIAKHFNTAKGHEHLQAFADGYNQLEQAGFKVLFISSESNKKLDTLKDELKLPFDMIHDKGNKIARTLGVMSKEGAKRSQVVVAKGGKVLLAKNTTILESFHEVAEVVGEQ